MAEAMKKAKAPSKPKKTAAKKAQGTAEVTAIDQPKAISHDEVARLAHRYWQERGHNHGNHVDDWFRAEQELRGKAS